MTTLPIVEGNAAEEYSNPTEAAAPDSSVVESVSFDAVPDVMIDEDVPAHAAPTIVAENAVEQSVVVVAEVADILPEFQLLLDEDEDTMSEWSAEVDGDEAWVAGEDRFQSLRDSFGANAAAYKPSFPIQELKALFQASAAVMSKSTPPVTAYGPFEVETRLASAHVVMEDSPELDTPLRGGAWVAGEDRLLSALFKAIAATLKKCTLPVPPYGPFEVETRLVSKPVVIEDSVELDNPLGEGAWVAEEDRFQALKDSFEANAPAYQPSFPFQELSALFQAIDAVIVKYRPPVPAHGPVEVETRLASAPVVMEDSAELDTPVEGGARVAIEESAEGVEAITTMIASTTMITIPAAGSTDIEATGDSTVPTQD